MVSTLDCYEKVVAEIEKLKGSTISVPELSQLLGVKPTTLNARFRREGIEVSTVGRTNYLRGELAAPLVDLHKYALKGWPTLKEVSRITAIKTGTLKARCEKGNLEGYVDLTKRLRINPAEATTLSLIRCRPAKQAETLQPQPKSTAPFSGEPTRRALTPGQIDAPLNGTSSACKPFMLPPAPEPRVQFITSRNPEFSGRVNEVTTSVVRPQPAPPVARKKGSLSYNPESPFSISECSVGKTIKYEHYDGTITKLINDPFNPTIKVALPKHDEPLMREILLRVGK